VKCRFTTEPATVASPSENRKLRFYGRKDIQGQAGTHLLGLFVQGQTTLFKSHLITVLLGQR
jgi:hypothetical protein